MIGYCEPLCGFQEPNKLREDTVRAFNAHHMEVVCVLFRWDALSINIIRSSVFHQVEFSSDVLRGRAQEVLLRRVEGESPMT